MSAFARWGGKTALITGASAGIGAEFARLLAKNGCHLVLTARRRQRLESLRDELVERYGVRVDVVVADLSQEVGASALYEEVAKLGCEIDLLINNAGYGPSGDVGDIDWDTDRAMIQVNVLALVELTKRFLPSMRRRDSGDILFVSSIAAYTAVPGFASYAATKAFVRQYGEALSYELRNTGVRATVLSPGGTMTEFADVAGMRETRLASLGSMSAESVARIGLQAMARGKRSVIAGIPNKALMWLTVRAMPLEMRLRASALFQKLAGGA